jgi:glycine betaine/proline transport system ATP-binding protein
VIQAGTDAHADMHAAIARLRASQRMYAFVLGADGRLQGAVSIDSMYRAMEAQANTLPAAFLSHITPVPATTVLRELVGRIVQNPVPLPVVDADMRYLGAVTQTILLKKMVEEVEANHE